MTSPRATLINWRFDMVKLVFLAMFIFVTLLASMSWTAGTQKSLSALAGTWRWLLLVAIWSQAALLPVMIDMTPEPWRVLAFLGVGCLMFTGATNVLDKNDCLFHTITAVAGFTFLVGWLMVVNDKCLLPAIVCIAAGRENWKWRVEVGLIISVYMAIVFHLFA